MGTVRFGNDHFTAITGYGDYVQGNLMICQVYYIEGLGHNLFSVGQFCDEDLEVAFCSNTFYVQNLEGDYLLTGSRESNLYTISISDLADSSSVCLMSKATSTKSWPMRVENEAPDTIINFINQVQRTLKAQILKIQTDNETEFKNKKLRSFYAKLGIVHHTSTARTPQQNGIVERQNCTLVEVVRTMHIFLKTLEFLWAEAIATACFTQNCSLLHTRYNNTPYELIRGRKPNVQYSHVFRSFCYPTNDRDDLGKMKPKADIGIFIVYSESSRGFQIYNRRTKKIMETIHAKFDELTTMASECNNSGPSLNCLNFQDSSKELNEIPSQQDLDNLFGPLYEEYFAPSTSEVSDNSATNTLDAEDTLSPSSIIVEDRDTPQIVTSSEEPTTQESSTIVLEIHSDEQI
ncbi:retrovirus-related pol polyprotein from transposon TNT 1-94 [Tanacetum coccineum]